MKKIILLLGGARSGKSRLAQEMAGKISDRVLYVATATAGDEDMRCRIARHRHDRPAAWRTLEAPLHIGRTIETELADAEVVIIDCITLLVNNIFCQYDEKEFEKLQDSELDADMSSEIRELTDCMNTKPVTFIIVSNEVGLGLVPDNRMGRIYRDCLGRANQMLAQAADEVYFLAAGIPLRIKPSFHSPENNNL